MTEPPLLEVDDLHVRFRARRSLLSAPPAVKAVNGVSFSIRHGETFGLVGESGSGKTTVARAVLRLVDRHEGAIRLDGADTDHLARNERAFRRRLSAVLQDPYSSLNRSHSVERIVGEVLTLHEGLRGRARALRVAELVDRVGLGAHFAQDRPRRLSGGQRQRVAIARALAGSPDLIVCDEPTSALDVSVQSQVINVLEELQAGTGVSYLFIAHDLSVVRHISHHIGVLYLGYLVESGPAQAVGDHPSHPYTAMLHAAAPKADPRQQRSRARLRRRIQVQAEAPSPSNLPPGCPFANRCPAAMDACHTHMPHPTHAHHGGRVRCHLHTSGPNLAGAPVADYLSSITR